MELELVSSDLCPFVQRSVIILNHKGVDHKMTTIDLDDPPRWFRDVSPFGKVPVLRVSDGETEEAIFESAVINEFLDEVSGGGLAPDDPVQRALNRAWTEVASACLEDVRAMVHAGDREGFEAHRAALDDRLQKMEARFSGGPFWNGPDMSLIDAAVAPLWMRLDAMEEFGITVLDADRFPKLAAYAEALLSRPEVYGSVPEDFEERNRTRLMRAGGHLAERIVVA